VGVGADVEPLKEAFRDIPRIAMNQRENAETGEKDDESLKKLNRSDRAESAKLPRV
jgi:hypothetical protein